MKLGLFSVSYAGYWGQQGLELPAFVAKAAELGYDSVMLMGKPSLKNQELSHAIAVARVVL